MHVGHLDQLFIAPTLKKKRKFSKPKPYGIKLALPYSFQAVSCRLCIFLNNR